MDWCDVCRGEHRHHTHVLKELVQDLRVLQEKAEQLMATAQEVSAAADRVTTSAGNAVARIQVLEASEANSVAQADLDPVVAALGATADALDAAVTVTAPAPAPGEVVPPEVVAAEAPPV